MKLSPHRLAAALLCAAPWATMASPSLKTVGNVAITCSGAANGNGVSGTDLAVAFFPGQLRCREAQTTPGELAKVQRSYLGPHGGSAQGNARARFGRVQVIGHSNTIDNEGHVALAAFADQWTLHVDGKPDNTMLRLTVRVRVKANGEAHGDSGSAGVSAFLHMNGGQSTGKSWGQRAEPSVPDVAFTVDQTWSGTLTVATGSGNAFYLGAGLLSRSGVAALGATGSAAVDPPAASLIWDGVVELRDYWTDELYTDWSLQSASGVDWRQPCPCTLP